MAKKEPIKLKWEASETVESPPDDITNDRVLRTAATFLQSIKQNSQMVILFEEYFGGESAFKAVVENRDFRYLFIQLMKVVTEYASISRKGRRLTRVQCREIPVVSHRPLG
jgi:hypothetical protein